MLFIVALLLSVSVLGGSAHAGAAKRPNILLVISDDQSYPHASAYGCKFIRTPAFDRVAREGVLFRNGYAASPGCSPSRASLLTGRHPWQNEQAGTHASSFPTTYITYTDLLEMAGYHVGFTGKPWGPGNFKASGRTRNPAGPACNDKKLTPPAKGINATDYAGNFKAFLQKRPKGAPFCFWYGASEPHRAFEKGIGLKAGKKMDDVDVPPFLPDADEVRSDLLDYAYEIEWFDQHLGKMLAVLDELGELDNTIIVVTADNGMAFPRAKANCYEYGTHVPLAIRWGNEAKGGRVVNDLVGFVDLAPTFLEAAGLKVHPQMAGKSLLKLLKSPLPSSPGGEGKGARGKRQVDPDRVVFTSRERHSSSRVDNLGYPSRGMRKGDYLYIRNFAPDRWPAGDPRGVSGETFGYYDIDASPTKTFLVANRDKYPKLFDLALAKRPAEELFDVRKDPANLVNLAEDPAQRATLQRLRSECEAYLRATGDPHMSGNGAIFESYPRYSPIRKFE